MSPHGQQRLEHFGHQFSEAAKILVEASRYGTSPNLEEQYVRLRSWLLLNYKGVRGDLRPLLPRVDSGLDRMLWHGSEPDSFERLMSFSTLDRAIRQPEAALAGQLKAIQTALDSAASGMVAV